ncbi:MAG: DUF2752 domain-containing protein [Lachnospiraceae bacterium]|nr:DUF2752 domain-containing protein [Lachnospiraceae bacterium]
MKAKKIPKIDYGILWKDFMIVNAALGSSALFVIAVMLLQRYHLIPAFPCFVHEFFNVYCPGCGGTRALFALFHGQVLHSLIYNPAIVLGAVLILYYEAGVLITLIRRNGKVYFYQKCGPLYSYLLIVILFAVIRNWLLIEFQIDLIKDFI